MKKKQWIECEIEKLVFGGYGLAHYEGKALFVHNALPDERVKAQVIKVKSSHIEAIATEVITDSPARLKPQEKHYLACSPWQILKKSQEAIWKQKIACETLKGIGKTSFEDINFIDDKRRSGYRNKMEFSFCQLDQGVSLAFFERGSQNKISTQNCILADPIINDTASKIVACLNNAHVSSSALKSLMIRSSRSGEIIAGLFVHDLDFIKHFPMLQNSLIDLQIKGFAIYYSHAQSPASVISKTLWEHGTLLLNEHLKGLQLSYGLHSFFQINLNLFEQVLQDMSGFVDSQNLIDLYCGVGSIGIALSNQASEVCFVDSCQDSINDLQKNIKQNQLKNTITFCKPSEKILDAIHFHSIVIVDPPRAGLHHRLVHKLRQTVPHQIIYLSCNLSTCARDLGVLLSQYQIKKIQCYNFFPMTPHFETLVILERQYQ